MKLYRNHIRHRIKVPIISFNHASQSTLCFHSHFIIHKRMIHSELKTKTLTRNSFIINESEAQLFAQLSEALFRDEAAAMSVELPNNNNNDEKEENNKNNNNKNNNLSFEIELSTENCMDIALNPLLSEENENQQQLQETKQNKLNNSSSLDIQNNNDSFSLVHAMKELQESYQNDNVSEAIAGAICSFISTNNSFSTRVGSELLLAGIDMKALILDGTLRELNIINKCMSQCDFSTLSFLSITATDVDFSRSLFYATIFHNVIFINCCFDGCIMKELRCSGNVRFEKCSFRFANIVLRISKGEKLKNKLTSNTSKVIFDSCDFDLAEFEGCDRLSANSFINCYNTHLASKFPLRV